MYDVLKYADLLPLGAFLKPQTNKHTAACTGSVLMFVSLCSFPHAVIVMSRDIEQGPEGECGVFSPSIFFPLFPSKC